MQAAAAGVALWGATVLARLPHGFESLEQGLKKPATSNKRVLIVAAAIIYCITRSDIRVRLWAIPLTALLTLAVQQHRVTYENESEESDLTEVFQ